MLSRSDESQRLEKQKHSESSQEDYSANPHILLKSRQMAANVLPIYSKERQRELTKKKQEHVKRVQQEMKPRETAVTPKSERRTTKKFNANARFMQDTREQSRLASLTYYIEKVEAEKRECTFKPNISKKSQRLVESSSRTHPQKIGERLYLQYKEQKQKIQEKIEASMPSFHPITNESRKKPKPLPLPPAELEESQESSVRSISPLNRILHRMEPPDDGLDELRKMLGTSRAPTLTSSATPGVMEKYLN